MIYGIVLILGTQEFSSIVQIQLNPNDAIIKLTSFCFALFAKL